MNGSNSLQQTDYLIGELNAGCCRMTHDANGTACVIATADRDPVAIRLERLQQYVTHLEVLIMHKNSEYKELQLIMESRVKDVLQKQAVQERFMIHEARHAAMGEMLGTIAHQWRQPLHAISLVVQNIQEAWECGELNDELLDRCILQAMEQIKCLSRTIDDFRTFLNPVKTTDYLCPTECVEECITLLSGWVPNFPSVEVRKSDRTEESVRIAGCQNAFKQAIFILLNNANDAVQGQRRRIGGTFRGRIVVDLQRRDDDVVIKISDNGGGIDEFIIEHIFEPYFTTKHKVNGIGIGLYIASLIIENGMNGGLWAENIPDGTLFGIRLPIAIEDRGLL